MKSLALFNKKSIVPFKKIHIEATEFWGDNTYMRELRIPAGTFAIGACHKFEHASVMISGSLYMWTPQTGTKFLSGYHPTIAKPGIQRVGYFLEDTIWVTSHHIESSVDKSEIVEWLTVKSLDDYKKYLMENSIEHALDISTLDDDNVPSWARNIANADARLLPYTTPYASRRA